MEDDKYWLGSLLCQGCLAGYVCVCICVGVCMLCVGVCVCMSATGSLCVHRGEK